MDSISDIRSAIEKSNFSLAQTLIENTLFDKKIKSAELYELYFDVLEKQSRTVDPYVILEYVDLIIPNDSHKALTYLNKITDKKVKDSQRFLFSEIKISERIGKVEKLYQLLSRYNIKSIERKNPVIPKELDELTQKYFCDDFSLKLQKLSISFLLNDTENSETLVKELILLCFERSNKRGQKNKLQSILEILELDENKQIFRIYKDFIAYLLEERDESKEIKRLVECVIYFDDYRFQVLLLEVMDKQYPDVSKDYSYVIKNNPNYNFVYLDKYFPHLKKYFVDIPQEEINDSVEEIQIDLKNIEIAPTPVMSNFYEHIDSEEFHFVNQIKNESFTFEVLIDFATALLQSDCIYACEETLKIAQKKSKSDDDTLKVRYLLVTCLFKKRDFRASLDLILDTLPYCKSENDLLSFLYAESEAYIKLEENENAIKVLQKIIKINAEYRLAKDRLEKLNEI